MVQLAKHAGLLVVADASEADEELVRSLGAVQDAAVLPAVKSGGRVATVRWYQGDGSRDQKVHAVSVADMAEEQGRVDELPQLAEDCAVTLRVADSYAPDEAWRAHERLEAGGRQEAVDV